MLVKEAQRKTNSLAPLTSAQIYKLSWQSIQDQPNLVHNLFSCELLNHICQNTASPKVY